MADQLNTSAATRKRSSTSATIPTSIFHDKKRRKIEIFDSEAGPSTSNSNIKTKLPNKSSRNSKKQKKSDTETDSSSESTNQSEKIKKLRYQISRSKIQLKKEKNKKKVDKRKSKSSTNLSTKNLNLTRNNSEGNLKKKGKKGIKTEIELNCNIDLQDLNSQETLSQPHKYPLRSQTKKAISSPISSENGTGTGGGESSGGGSSSSVSPHLPRKSIRERGKKENFELGASSSNTTAPASAPARDSQEPQSRLTRSSGVILRRSTRTTKSGTHSSTTGSCASSSSGGATGGSRRPARQQKVIPATPGLLAAPTTPHAAAPTTHSMANQDQPELTNNRLSGTEEPPSPQEGTQALSGGGAGAQGGGGADSESDDSEVGRLQALLEARGLPPHLFGALGPRMQQMLHRSMGTNSSVARAQALIPGLQATGDEGQQLQAVIEMCQVLVMGNEEILTGFPVKQVVPALITLLGMDHNFDIMNHACRALTYMMEALPRSSAVVVDAVPVFLEKLQVIQCMDVAEQSLTALDMLSRRHSKAILQAHGVSACLTYLDFFSINAQRNALSITANCCLNLAGDEFHHVHESLPLLAARLTQPDKKCVESVCLAFSRLVDSFHSEPIRLQEIATPQLLTNLQQLLVVTPPIVSTGVFITVLRMLAALCATCPDLALALLKQNIAETLVYLLTGRIEGNQDEVELIPRQSQEQFEITALIGELMPKLPTDGIFAVDNLVERHNQSGNGSGNGGHFVRDEPIWQWRDDRGLWHSYGVVDSRIIEAAHLNSEDEVSLNTLGRIYTIDFHSMQQINEDTGTSRHVQRRLAPTSIQSCHVDPPTIQNRPLSASRDARVACLREERGLAAAFIRSLFSVLYEVYSSSAGPAVRYKCLRALLRMVYYANPELLKDVLKNQIVSSHIAGMMASNDLRIVVGALQMAEILMNKLPEEFGVHFRREGVLHQIHRLADPEVPLGVSPPKSSTSSTTFTNTTLESQPGTSQASAPNGSPISSFPPQESSTESTRSPSPSHVRLSDVLKRKRVAKRSGATGGAAAAAAARSSKTRHDTEMALSPSLMQDLFTKAASIGNSTPGNSTGRSRYSGSSQKSSSFLQSLNPARWGRSMNSSHDRNYSKDSLNNLSKSASNSHITAGNREKTRSWIREQASKFIENHCSSSNEPHPATTVVTRLKHAIEKLPTNDCQQALLDLREILIESDISPFEINYSGLIKALLTFLTKNDNKNKNKNNKIIDNKDKDKDDDDKDLFSDREQRLRILLNVFAGLPIDGADVVKTTTTTTTTMEVVVESRWMGSLVAKLNGCVSQLEQFPVKVHDLPASSSGAGRGGGTSALKFFNTHQLKCNLQRHPDCSNLKQWKGGTVKIDPLALVQAIERYLVVRGYGRLRDKDVADSDDNDSDDDIDDSLAGVAISQTGQRHKLQFLIGNTVLPYNMTVYQAVRQFGNNGNDQSETDTDNETPLGNAGIWVQTHVIYYRPLKEENNISIKNSNSSGISSHSSRKGKGFSGKNTNRRKTDELWTEGVTPPTQSPLTPYLFPNFPENITIQDASLDVLCLMRILNALNAYWTHLYPNMEHRPIVPPSDFLNSKIAAKATRQLQDPLVIMTGNLPNWLSQIAMVCPFLFPFETRQLLFYATSFDRDRALQRLLDMSPELSSSDSTERVTPRLERRKRTIARDDILKQAEQLMQDLATSKALLEVQYENEVGTGLGPTLEFYALVSNELQRTNLDLWNSSGTTSGNLIGINDDYVYCPMGLFPAPLPRSAKVSQITKIKSKFRFLGKFMAKAVMDSRMLDLPFSLTFYRWLLGQENNLTLSDLKYVNPELYKTLRKMHFLVKKRDEILSRQDLNADQRLAEIEKIDFDGCPIEDLGIDFVMPGYNIELMKGGKSIHVTIHNLDLYVKLMTHWILIEGVQRQMEALREGFESVFPLHNLKVFLPEELEAVFCGSPKDVVVGWDVKTLMECCRPDHGYTSDSRAIRWLFQVLSSYDRDEQRMFVQFLTGSPRLPVGGFKALSPPLTVVRKTLESNMNPDLFLPSVMTCVNYLKLPDYSTIDVMREKLRLAASEGQHSFYLS